MNKIVMRFLTVSTLSFVITNIDGNLEGFAQAVTCKPTVEGVIQIGFGTSKTGFKIDKDNAAMRAFNKKVTEKAGEQYTQSNTIAQVPLSNALRAMDGKLDYNVVVNPDSSGNARKAEVSLPNLYTGASDDKLIGGITAGVAINQDTGSANALNVNIKLDPSGLGTSVHLTKSSDENAAQISSPVCEMHDFPLSVTPSIKRANQSDNISVPVSGVLTKNTSENWQNYEKFDTFKEQSGAGWTFNGDVRGSVQFNAPSGGFVRVGGVFKMPLAGKTITCKNTDTDSNKTTDNTEKKDELSYDVTQKTSWGGFVGFGGSFTEKFDMCLNLVVTRDSFAFAPTSNNKSNDNNTSDSTTNNNLIKVNDKIDMKCTSISTELNASYKFTDHIGMFAGVGFTPGRKLSNKSSTPENGSIFAPLTVEKQTSFYIQAGVQFNFG